MPHYCLCICVRYSCHILHGRIMQVYSELRLHQQCQLTVSALGAPMVLVAEVHVTHAS